MYDTHMCSTSQIGYNFTRWITINTIFPHCFCSLYLLDAVGFAPEMPWRNFVLCTCNMSYTIPCMKVLNVEWLFFVSHFQQIIVINLRQSLETMDLHLLKEHLCWLKSLILSGNPYGIIHIWKHYQLVLLCPWPAWYFSTRVLYLVNYWHKRYQW